MDDNLFKMMTDHSTWIFRNGNAGVRFEYHGDLRCVDMHKGLLCRADLSCADLRGANLSECELAHANLRGANLDGALLYGANLFDADLTDAKGLITQEEYLDKTFEKTNDGFIVYKIFGYRYSPNKSWIIEPGSIIEDHNCNMDRRELCAPGINVATLAWAMMNARWKPIHKCLIRHEWVDGICVPHATNGKIRCKKLEIIEITKKWGLPT